tara:strand:+ start:1449 stop:1724 length:276 start_codon:yes stop_codon:yes gene_type:complete
MRPTPNEQHGFFGLLLMLSWYLLRRLRAFLQRPYRLSLKAPRLDLSVQHNPRASDEKPPLTIEPSETPTTDDESSIARRTAACEKDSTTRD